MGRGLHGQRTAWVEDCMEDRQQAAELRLGQYVVNEKRGEGI